MDDSQASSLEQIQTFLAGSTPVQFAGQGRVEVYAWTEKTLVRHEYASLGKAEKGLLRRYLAQMTGLSRAQLTRLINSYRTTGQVKAAVYQRTKFATRYTGRRCGPAGVRRQSSWQPERAGDTANPGARVRRIWASGIRPAGRNFGGPSVSIAQLGSLPQT